MLKINFYIKADKAKLNGECPIYAKVIFDHKSITLSTGRYILPERWKFSDNMRHPVKIEKEKVIKQYLEIFRINIEKIYYDIKKKELDVSIEEFKAMIQGKSSFNKIPTLIELIEIHNKHFAKLVAINERSKASLQKYERVKDIVIAYNKNYYKSPDFTITKINGAYIYNLESFMKFESSYNDKIGIKNNSVVKYFKNLKTIAHNGFGFDFPVLDKTLEYYNLPIPDYNKLCTYKIYKSNLAKLCQQHNIPLNHHNALSDARACAELYLKCLKK